MNQTSPSKDLNYQFGDLSQDPQSQASQNALSAVSGAGSASAGASLEVDAQSRDQDGNEITK